jgi:hypothetical protein
MCKIGIYGTEGNGGRVEGKSIAPGGQSKALNSPLRRSIDAQRIAFVMEVAT